MDRLTRIIAIVFLAASFSGCAVFLADIHGLQKIKPAHVKVFDKDQERCYELTKAALAEWHAVVFQTRKYDYIVAMELDYVFMNCVNTTELGIFFTEKAPGKTEVKVTSLNYQLSEFVADNLFNYIEKNGDIPPGEKLAIKQPKRP